MTAWLVILAVGLGSFAFRAVPLLVAGGAGQHPWSDRLIRHASTAALTALVVSSTLGANGTGPLLPSLAAVGVGTLAAARGRSMLVVVGVGMAAFWAVTAAMTLVPLIG